MAKDYRQLQSRMSAAAQERSQAKARDMMAEMSLNELRSARAITQEHLASLLGIRQASVSKMEKRADMYVSTLRHFIEAMGGELEIRAVFPDTGSVRIGQFGELGDPADALGKRSY